jgi:DNA-directed RNA polymerase subunit H (RpoH/RPB5)
MAFNKNIYNTIVETILTKFINYRKLTLIENEDINNSIIDEMNRETVEIAEIAETYSKKLSSFHDIITNNIKNAGYIQINTKKEIPRGNRDIVVFLVLSNDDKLGDMKKNKNIKKIIDTALANESVDEIIIIAEKMHFNKKPFIDIVQEFKRHEKSKDFDGEKPIFNAYPSINFLFDLPNHCMVPKHRIMTDAEIQSELFSEYIKKNDIYTIYEFDPPIVWLGGREGQVVEVIRQSISTLEAPVYRLIKAELYKPII